MKKHGVLYDLICKKNIVRQITLAFLMTQKKILKSCRSSGSLLSIEQ